MKHDPMDQRAWMRFPVELRARVQRIGAAVNPFHDGQRLPSGIGILVAEPVETGTLLSVDLINPSGSVVKTILACIVHVTRHANGEYSLGCNFIRQLQEEELKSLV